MNISSYHSKTLLLPLLSSVLSTPVLSWLIDNLNYYTSILCLVILIVIVYHKTTTIHTVSIYLMCVKYLCSISFKTSRKKVLYCLTWNRATDVRNRSTNKVTHKANIVTATCETLYHQKYLFKLKTAPLLIVLEPWHDISIWWRTHLAYLHSFQYIRLMYLLVS